MKKIIALFTFICYTFVVSAQDSAAVKITSSQKRIDDKTVALTITAYVKKAGVKLFALPNTQDSLVFSSVKFDTAAVKFITGAIAEKGSIQTAFDSTLGANARFVTDSIQFIQNINVSRNDSIVVKGVINYVYQDGDDYPALEESFRINIIPQAGDAMHQDGTNAATDKSLLWIFLAAFGGGLIALITPCVYSMIPVTVSFFTKRSKTRQQGIRNAVLYALSIIIIFTLLGFLITLIFGPTALNKLATNWIANLIFFALFVAFGFSFLGAFEIELPSSWSTKADSKASSGNFLGIFFMALTLVIVSFSCTGPIIGNLLVLASKGSYMGPLVGMFGFSLALALPFALFAFFPNKLNMLGKAGGWLNAVKVTLGFLELALALKFLSNADLAKGWRILDREIFIVLWIVIFLLLGLYLLGKLKFKHDSELPKNDFDLPYLSVTRLMFAIASFSMVVYLTPGLFGAPLKALSAFLPPMGTQDFNADDLPKGFDINNIGKASSVTDSHDSEKVLHPVKYVDFLGPKEPPVIINNAMVTYFDYDEALVASRKLKKPLMLDFTGVNCPNCREMEGKVWSDPEVMKRLKNDFVIASLYTDVQEYELPEAEQFYSEAFNKKVITLGEKFYHLQISKFGTVSQPSYFFLDGDEKRLVNEEYAYDPSVSKFIKHLDRVLEEYKKRNP